MTTDVLLDVPFRVRLPQQLHERLRAEADKRAVNLSEVTRRLLEAQAQTWEEENLPPRSA